MEAHDFIVFLIKRGSRRKIGTVWMSALARRPFIKGAGLVPPSADPRRLSLARI